MGLLDINNDAFWSKQLNIYKSIFNKQSFTQKAKDDERAIRQLGAKLRRGRSIKRSSHSLSRVKKIKRVVSDEKVQKNKNVLIENDQFDINRIVGTIIRHTDIGNVSDNDKVVAFLKGNKNAIWDLYILYKHKYSGILRHRGLDSRSTEMDLDDLVIEMYANVIKNIELGKFKGINFFNWSVRVIEYSIRNYYKKNGYTVEYKAQNIRNKKDTYPLK